MKNKNDSNTVSLMAKMLYRKRNELQLRPWGIVRQLYDHEPVRLKYFKKKVALLPKISITMACLWVWNKNKCSLKFHLPHILIRVGIAERC